MPGAAAPLIRIGHAALIAVVREPPPSHRRARRGDAGFRPCGPRPRRRRRCGATGADGEHVARRSRSPTSGASVRAHVHVRAHARLCVRMNHEVRIGFGPSPVSNCCLHARAPTSDTFFAAAMAAADLQRMGKTATALRFLSRWPLWSTCTVRNGCGGGRGGGTCRRSPSTAGRCCFRPASGGGAPVAGGRAAGGSRRRAAPDAVGTDKASLQPPRAPDSGPVSGPRLGVGLIAAGKQCDGRRGGWPAPTSSAPPGWPRDSVLRPLASLGGRAGRRSLALACALRAQRSVAWRGGAGHAAARRVS